MFKCPFKILRSGCDVRSAIIGTFSEYYCENYPNFVDSSTLTTLHLCLVSGQWGGWCGEVEVTKGRAVLYEVGLTPWQAVAVQWWSGAASVQAAAHRLAISGHTVS